MSTTNSVLVTGTGSDAITFTSYSSPAFYFLDDVSLVNTSLTSVPEPATLALLLVVCGSFSSAPGPVTFNGKGRIPGAGPTPTAYPGLMTEPLARRATSLPPLSNT
jgi:hypothetical protein